MFTRDFIQAVSDWQRGGDQKQKQRRALRLKQLSSDLDGQFRRCDLVVYRQIALLKGGVWNLIAERSLSEAISGWTLQPAVAKTFKGGVPPEGWQGVILALRPPEGSVVINLEALYRSSEFIAALGREKGRVEGFAEGAGLYGGTQSEVVLEVASVDDADIYALGGYSSDRDTLIRMMFNTEPTDELIAWFEANRTKAGVEIGAYWLEGDGLQRVLTRMKPHIERLKQVKAAEAAPQDPD